MRDGVKLFTIMVIPNGAHNAPILLTRTPYNAAGTCDRTIHPIWRWLWERATYEFVKAGYIRVFQDIRGKFDSEGAYVMTTPPTGPLNPDGPNDTTDAWDTIDWLSKNVPESNGKVGMIGISYEGFTVVMALLHPHPALKVAAPESPMVDGWMGDDWFHYGAFRKRISIIYWADRACAAVASIPRLNRDDYTNFLEQARRATLPATAAWSSFPSGARLKTTRLRRILAGASAGQTDRQGTADRAHHVGAGAVGPGRHVGRQPLLSAWKNPRTPTTT